MTGKERVTRAVEFSGPDRLPLDHEDMVEFLGDRNWIVNKWHFVEHAQAVVARETVGAQRDGDAAFAQLPERMSRVTEIGLASWAKDYVAALQKRNVII